MAGQSAERALERGFGKTAAHKLVLGAVARVESGDGSLSWCGTAGSVERSSSFFIASTTKLYVTATLLKLQELGWLRLDDPASAYVERAALEGVHRYRGKDYSFELTIRQLMAHTSGLPDYLQAVRDDGKSLLQHIQSGRDRAWTFEQALEDTKRLKPLFAPGTPGKAHYSDTNYQLLGNIIEQVTGGTVDSAFRTYIYEPLGLRNTYMYRNAGDDPDVPLYYNNEPLHIPQAMASFGPDGGIVSTADELLTFLRAFFEGRLFPKQELSALYAWNRIFFPLQYGAGVAKFQMPRVFTMFRQFPELLGHSGLSGTFAYYCPAKDVYFAGTVNQVAQPSLPYRLMMELLNRVKT